MPNLNLVISSVTITPFSWSTFLAITISAFFIWRRLSKEYSQEEVYKFISLLFVLIFFFSLLGSQIGLGLFFGFVSCLLSARIWARNPKINFWEVVDTLSLPLNYVLLFEGLGLFLKNNDFRELRYFVSGLLGIVVYLLLKNRYRSFSWYKSGKTGFLFWSNSAVVFLLLFLLAFATSRAVFWQDISLILVVAMSLVMLYLRAERKPSEDFHFLSSLKKRKESVKNGKNNFSKDFN